MKKILSLTMVLAMMLTSYTAVVKAADATLTITPTICSYNVADEEEGDPITEANEGDYVALLMEFESSDGFAAYGFNVNFDKDVFEYADTSYVVYKSRLPEPTAVTSTSWGLSIVGGSGSNIDESKGPALVVVLKVKEDLKADDYTITLSDILDSNGNPNNCDASGTTLPGVYAPASVYVNGTKADAPSIVEATKVVEDKNNKADKAEGEKYTQGFKVTVTGNDQVVTAVPFTLTADGTTEEFAGFTGLEITGATPAVLGLNVKEIPYDKTVAAEFSLTIAE